MPVAINDAAVTVVDTAVTIDVIANDVDPDVGGGIDPSTVNILTPPQNGVAVINPLNGQIVYSPNSGFTGQDVLLYQVRDVAGEQSNIATVQIDVLPSTTGPIAVDDLVGTLEDTPIQIDVLANDLAVGLAIDPTTVELVTLPTLGSATAHPVTGIITYAPNSQASGADVFTYRVRDAGGAVSNVATVTLGVISVPDPPIVFDDVGVVEEDGATAIVVLANDLTQPGDAIDVTTVTIVDPPSSGIALVDPVTGVVGYSPVANFNGPDFFRYTVTSVAGVVSDPGRVDIFVVPVNDAPVAVDDTGQVFENTQTLFNVLANDTDIDSALDPTSVTIVSGPFNGIAVVDPVTGAIFYTPNPDFFGPDTITYRMRDVDGTDSNVATLSIEVLEVNDLPVAAPDFAQTLEDTPVLIDILNNDFDLDNGIDPTTVEILIGPANGITQINPLTGDVTYTPNPEFSGIDTFSYVVRDLGGALSNLALVQINVIDFNDPPIAFDDFVATVPNTPVVIPIAGNSLDLDGTIDPASVTIVQNASRGTLIPNPTTGEVTYVPNAGFQGLDRFTFRVRDNGGALSNIAEIIVRVGDPVSIAGSVYVDTNGNGLRDPGEVGIPNVQILIDKIDGPIMFTETVFTDLNGNYLYTATTDFGSAPPGTYNVREIQPFGFLDGIDTPGVPPPGITLNDQFNNLVLGSGVDAEGFLFGEGGLALGLQGIVESNQFYASTVTPEGLNLLEAGTTESLNLGGGDYWYGVDAGWQGAATFTAVHNPAAGSANLTLYDAQMQVMAQGVQQGGATSLSYSATAGQAYVLKVSGTNSNVSLQSAGPQVALPAGPAGESTVGAVNPATATFFLRYTNNSGDADVPAFNYGLNQPSWIPLAGDWDGNGVDTVGVYNADTATFFLRNENSAGASDVQPFNFGLPGWVPVVGDWNGDGVDTVGVYNPQTATFFLRNSNTTGVADVAPFNYGLPGWQPLAGDWNGDGTDTIGVYNAQTATFFLRNSNTSGDADVPAFNYGLPGWQTIVGDWNNDGTDTVGVYNPQTATYFLRNANSSGVADVPAFNYGLPGWRPIAGDWNPGGQALTLGPDAAATAGSTISVADVTPLVEVALGLWSAAGVDPVAIDRFSDVDVVIADLAGDRIGWADGQRIYLDANAAGAGWFVDATPENDDEFAGDVAGVDLLTALAHELGHLLGMVDLDESQFADHVMSELLAPGQRNLPSAIDEVLSDLDE